MFILSVSPKQNFWEKKKCQGETNFMAQARVGHSLNFLLFIYGFALSLYFLLVIIKQHHVINIEDELQGVSRMKG
jgi:hypothetical protein